MCVLFRFDDGDRVDSVEDYSVIGKLDYLLSTRKAVCSDDDDDDRDTEKWMGVKNKVNVHCIDKYYREVG